YRPFVEAEGYHQEQWWTEAGRAWRRGAEADLSVIDNKDLRKRYADWLAGRPAAWRDRPFWWDDSQWGAATRPVVGVTWHEAVAYCRWLTAHMRAAGKLTENENIRLPNEAEWEKAARGPDGRRWPWSDDWEEDRANTQETGLGQTSPVGLFPKGASPYGVHDMAGNVWEWTGSLWGRTSIDQPNYHYPYNPRDGREREDRSGLFVVRGGSWVNDRLLARAACRNWNLPVNFNVNLGFRVVVSLANSGF
ncbi:MAG: SUMF1/EgtB/PvdO family nonheme iron enzyme, partial [Candidatus Competibacter sp.]